MDIKINNNNASLKILRIVLLFFNQIDQDMTFKVARTRILMQYVNQGSVASSPFNLIPFKATVKYIYSLVSMFEFLKHLEKMKVVNKGANER